MATLDDLRSDAGIQDLDDGELQAALDDETLPIELVRNVGLELARRARTHAAAGARLSRPPTREIAEKFDPAGQTREFRKWHREHEPVDLPAAEAECRRQLTPRAELALAQRQNLLDGQAAAYEVFKTAAARMFPGITDEAAAMGLLMSHPHGRRLYEMLDQLHREVS